MPCLQTEAAALLPWEGGCRQSCSGSARQDGVEAELLSLVQRCCKNSGTVIGVVWGCCQVLLEQLYFDSSCQPQDVGRLVKCLAWAMSMPTPVRCGSAFKVCAQASGSRWQLQIPGKPVIGCKRGGKKATVKKMATWKDFWCSVRSIRMIRMLRRSRGVSGLFLKAG